MVSKEPPRAERHAWWCERSESESRKKTTSFSSYSIYIRKNGDIKTLCGKLQRNSVGICYEGGVDSAGSPADTRTEFQKHSLRVLVMLLLRDYPGCRLAGCPGLCFDAETVLREPPPPNPAYY
ncbi:hypothetical protein [Bacteroides sp. BFG-257]|uniref:hypothetical protein n=1 Tax=Bacteroides TaxID=816 RepID=UPI0038D0A69F